MVVPKTGEFIYIDGPLTVVGWLVGWSYPQYTLTQGSNHLEHHDQSLGRIILWWAKTQHCIVRSGRFIHPFCGCAALHMFFLGSHQGKDNPKNGSNSWTPNNPSTRLLVRIHRVSPRLPTPPPPQKTPRMLGQFDLVGGTPRSERRMTGARHQEIEQIECTQSGPVIRPVVHTNESLVLVVSSNRAL